MRAGTIELQSLDTASRRTARGGAPARKRCLLPPDAYASRNVTTSPAAVVSAAGRGARTTVGRRGRRAAPCGARPRLQKAPESGIETSAPPNGRASREDDRPPGAPARRLIRPTAGQNRGFGRCGELPQRFQRGLDPNEAADRKRRRDRPIHKKRVILQTGAFHPACGAARTVSGFRPDRKKAPRAPNPGAWCHVTHCRKGFFSRQRVLKLPQRLQRKETIRGSSRNTFSDKQQSIRRRDRDTGHDIVAREAPVYRTPSSLLRRQPLAGRASCDDVGVLRQESRVRTGVVVAISSETCAVEPIDHNTRYRYPPARSVNSCNLK